MCIVLFHSVLKRNDFDVPAILERKKCNELCNTGESTRSLLGRIEINFENALEND